MQRVPALPLLTLGLSAALLTTALVIAPAAASAEELTSHGNLVFSAERLMFGLTGWTNL